MSEVLSAIHGALGNGHFIVLYLISIILAVILFTGNRKSFVIPSLVLTIVICNPFFYNLWNKINGYAYWRTLWVIPVVPLCAAMPSLFIEKTDKWWLRTFVLIGFVLVFVNTGYFIYNNPSTTFTVATNADKLPEAVVQVGGYLLKIDDGPSIVCDSNISTYIRQYSGKIKTPYGRDIVFGGADQGARDIYRHLVLNEMEQLSTHMLNEGYEYLVIREDSENRREEIEQAGFELLEHICGNGIYRVKGLCSENSEYDERGRLVGKRYYDINGNLSKQTAGHVAYTQEWVEDTLATRTYLDKNNNPINRIDGYSKVVFNENNNIEFYDINGTRVDSGNLNLARDIDVDSEGWSEWITPYPNENNFYYIIGSTKLARRTMGQKYTCHVEIEFSNVKATQDDLFRFYSQGASDGKWEIGNVWNSGLVYLDKAPENGIFTYSSTVELTEAMIGISEYELGFRCDYWSNGSFRVRNVLIEEGIESGAWRPGI